MDVCKQPRGAGSGPCPHRGPSCSVTVHNGRSRVWVRVRRSADKWLIRGDLLSCGMSPSVIARPATSGADALLNRLRVQMGIAIRDERRRRRLTIRALAEVTGLPDVDDAGDGHSRDPIHRLARRAARQLADVLDEIRRVRTGERTQSAIAPSVDISRRGSAGSRTARTATSTSTAARIAAAIGLDAVAALPFAGGGRHCSDGPQAGASDRYAGPHGDEMGMAARGAATGDGRAASMGSGRDAPGCGRQSGWKSRPESVTRRRAAAIGSQRKDSDATRCAAWWSRRHTATGDALRESARPVRRGRPAAPVHPGPDAAGIQAGRAPSGMPRMRSRRPSRSRSSGRCTSSRRPGGSRPSAGCSASAGCCSRPGAPHRPRCSSGRMRLGPCSSSAECSASDVPADHEPRPCRAALTGHEARQGRRTATGVARNHATGARALTCP